MPESMTTKVLGIMSGTSLDGVDLALCEFKGSGDLQYRLLFAETIKFPYYLREQLEDALHISTQSLHDLDQSLGNYIAKLANGFIDKYGIKPDLISSHGHTVLHQPAKGVTLQIGDGDVIARQTRIPVINDFRIQDVSKGGQGAPLVPIGDRDLFKEYDFCLNLGGIANISFDHKGERIACDISPCNMALNTISSWIDKPYDENGEIARTGKINTDLLQRLNQIDYYKNPPPKSIGKEWFIRTFLPEIRITELNIEDALRTVNEHIAVQISEFMNQWCKEKASILVTGGGTYNKFLIELIQNKCRTSVVIPNNNLIDFKEAIIFAYLGYLRYNGKINVLASVTGASSDTCAGIINYPN